MAKAKKGKLTIEDALVPVEEQPYEIPENWCWTTLDMVADYKKGPFGSSITKAMFVPKGENTYKVYEQGNAIRKTVQYGEYYITKEKFEELKGFEIHPGDLIVSCAGTIGETYQLPEIIEEGVINQALMRVKVSEKVDLKYYLYYFDEMLRQDITGNSKGSAIKNIPPFAVLKKFPYPLPPLAEQKRIVEQIENLFSKLDEAKDKAQFVVESYESRKKAILHNAFEGLYSAEWRKKNKCSIDDWKDTKINEVCIPRAGYAFDSKKFTTDGFQIIRMGNLYAGKLDLSRSPVFYDRNDVDDSILKRSLVHDGDILLTLTGTKYKRDYGYAVCIEGNPELLVNQRILCLTPTEKIERDYLLYYLRSEIFRDIFFSNETGGVNQGNVSSKFVENIEIKLPSIDEQKEISRILRTVLDNEERAKDTAEYVIEQIDIIKKSILAKAFRGELGTNIADDERAIELLKSIIEA